jgi:methionyl-tRNA formyltransferase
MTNNVNYIIASHKSWSKKIFAEIINKYPGNWHLIEEKEELTLTFIKEINPRYIFFLHWSWKVSAEIIDNYECVCFHMTEVPYGRGGSPLQNLIIRGHQQTKLTALRMTEEFDAGAVYLKQDLCLSGNAEEIYIRATYLCAEMIKQIIEKEISPIPQHGEGVVFKRRKPDQSKIPQLDSLLSLHDFIRMLDADGYPKSFIEYQGFRYEFSRSALYNGKIIADVTITPIEDNQE